jgi:hypothetical protein
MGVLSAEDRVHADGIGLELESFQIVGRQQQVFFRLIFDSQISKFQ